MGFMLILFIIGAVFGIVIFIYSLIFLINIPKDLARIADSLDEIKKRM